MTGEDSRRRLVDPNLKDWEKGYQDRIDVLVMLAADDRADLEKVAAEVRRDAEAVCQVRTVEWLGVKTNVRGQMLEHFGYVDEISQPLFFRSELAAKVQGDLYNPSAPLRLVLVQEDPRHAPNRYGSYLVVRKLQQDVPRFEAELKKLARGVNVSEDLAAAMLVGRFKDGTPVCLAEKPQQTDTNAFSFAADPDGHKCPLHAHIRRVNPRGTSTEQHAAERSHRIVRRSMLYGLGQESATVGTLFLCFQASIDRQFVFIQKHWVNSPSHPRPGTALDPLITTGKVPESETGQVIGFPPPVPRWPTTWGGASRSNTRSQAVSHSAAANTFLRRVLDSCALK